MGASDGEECPRRPLLPPLYLEEEEKAMTKQEVRQAIIDEAQALISHYKQQEFMSAKPFYIIKVYRDNLLYTLKLKPKKDA